MIMGVIVPGMTVIVIAMMGVIMIVMLVGHAVRLGSGYAVPSICA
jgi:hypothetical protein